MNYLAELLKGFLQDELLYRLTLAAIIIMPAYLVSKLLGFLTKKILNPLVAKT